MTIVSAEKLKKKIKRRKNQIKINVIKEFKLTELLINVFCNDSINLQMFLIKKILQLVFFPFFLI
jgi:protoheme ferro-lyase